jgi:hypothetical protein
MISVEQYRSSIGTFSGQSIGNYSPDIDNNRHTSVFCVFALSILLIMAGDVETNPGPPRNQILDKIDKLKKIIEKRENKAQMIPKAAQKMLLKNISRSLNLLQKKKALLPKHDITSMRKLEKLRLNKLAHNTFKPDLHKLDDTPMNKEHKLYGDRNIKVYIKRVKFAKQKNFAMKDYQYQVKVKQTDSTASAPLFKDVADNMHLALSNLIKELQQQLDPRKHSQIYFCFIHPDLAANIYTGNYPLYANNSDQISDEVFQRLASTLRSFQYIALDASFEIKIKILSVEHVAHKLKTKGMKKGASHFNILSNETVKSVITIPDDDLRFRNKCLPAAVLLGYYFSRHAKHRYDKTCAEDAKIYTAIQRLNQRITSNMRLNHAVRAKNRLLELISEFVCKLGYANKGPFEMTEFLKKSAKLLKVRFHVFSSQGNRCCFVYPEEFDDKLPQIYLYKEEQFGKDVSHMSLIININSFMSRAGYPCLYCSKTRYRYYHHCTKRGISCFSCKKVNLTNPSTYVDNQNKRTFCFKLPTTQREKSVCLHCNITIVTKDCAKRHKGNVKVCNRGFYCNNCKTFNLRPNAQISLEDFKAKHKCNEELCRLCYENFTIGQDHFCEMRRQNAHYYMKNLAFFDLESFTGADCQACTVCYEKEQLHILRHQTRIIKLSQIRDLVGNMDIQRSNENGDQEKKFFSYLFNTSEDSFDEEYVFSTIGSIDANTYRTFFADKQWCKILLKRSEICKLIKMSVLKEENVRCDMHTAVEDQDESVHVPNYAVLYYENEKHGRFNRIDFADPLMAHENDCCIIPNVFETSYLPNFIDDTVKTNKVRGLGMKKAGSLTKFPVTIKTFQTGQELNEADEENGVDVANFINYECQIDDDTEAEDDSDDECEERNEMEASPSKKRCTSNIMFGKIPNLSTIQPYPVVDKLLLFICNEAFRNYVFISHNGSAYDMQFICEACYRQGIAPKMITRDMRILQLNIPQFNITFLDSI